MTIRYHLKVLQADNLIVVSTLRRQHGPGRPQQVYKLTDAANEFFPEDYHGLTNYLLEHAQYHPNPYRLPDYRRWTLRISRLKTIKLIIGPTKRTALLYHILPRLKTQSLKLERFKLS